MTDTEILNGLIDDLRWHVKYQRPMSPLLIGQMLRDIEKDRYRMDRFHVKQSERRGDDDECKHQTS